jgi:hypothetical protein
MYGIIAIFCPSIVGVKLIDYLNKEEKRGLFYDYIILLISSLVLNNVITYVLFNIHSNIFENLNQLPIYWVKFVIVSVIINIILALLIVVVKKNVSIKVEVVDCEKTKPKTKSKKKKNK